MAAGKVDVAHEEVLLAFPVEIKRKVVSRASDEYEEAEEDGAEARAEPCVVVSCALPGWKSMVEEMVVTCSSFSQEDLIHQPEPGIAVAGFFGVGFDLLLGWLTAYGRLAEGTLDFVGVHCAGFLLEGG